ncbi:MAG: YvcK family protein [Armatimonadota bacterium]|nr:YvcK family protein [Armatimonadota bacterium]MDR7401853.1 YvcK family protein [Armatimonadota bacterium]MDR7437431.1 YvcK family protein [Armatimonadota bacterium]MDR7473182.1 YvcK family protein [Armatimonadota bacterium]MDR7506940.1 YvcK family protein [Armatimonadota bacterium]
MDRPLRPAWLRWLAPGLGVKRYVALMAAGILALSAGTMLMINVQPLGWVESLVFRATLRVLRVTGGRLSATGVAVVLLAGGVAAVFAGLRGTVRSVADALLPAGGRPLVDVLARQRQRRRGPHVVVVGGGTGLSTLLRGLKAHTDNLTAVVTVFDDGGSSGRLRRELGVLPPGDIRDCLVALAESEPLLTRLFEYRFRGGALDGHAFGNLFLASLTGVTGDLVSAIREASKVLNIRGRVLPSAVQDVVLWAEFTDGTAVEGESQITRARKRIRRVGLRPAGVAPAPEVLEALGEADLIVLGPGSLYTSVIPNLLVQGVADAIRRSRAVRVYVCNVMTQPGETDGFAASDHVRALVDQVGPGLVSHVVVNTQRPRHPTVLSRYLAEGAAPVEPDLDRVAALGVVPVPAALLSEEDVLRHDPARLARLLLHILQDASRAGDAMVGDGRTGDGGRPG